VAADVEPTPVSDVLGDLAPGDFQGSLDTSASVGGLAADAGVQLEADGLDANVRVDAPAASADLGTSLGAGPAAAALQLQVAPSQLAADTSLGAGGAGGAALQLQTSPGQVGTGVTLDTAVTPAALALAAESEGIAIDVSSGGLVPQVLGGADGNVEVDRLPLDLPLDLRLH